MAVFTVANSKFESPGVSVVPASCILDYNGIDTIAREGVILDGNSTRTLARKKMR